MSYFEGYTWQEIDQSHRELWDHIEGRVAQHYCIDKVLTPKGFQAVIHAALQNNFLSSSLRRMRTENTVDPILNPSRYGQFCCSTVCKWAMDLYLDNRLAQVWNPKLALLINKPHEESPHGLFLYRPTKRTFLTHVDRLHFDASRTANPPHPTMANARVDISEWAKPKSEDDYFRVLYEPDANQESFFQELTAHMHEYLAMKSAQSGTQIHLEPPQSLHFGINLGGSNKVQ